MMILVVVFRFKSEERDPLFDLRAAAYSLKSSVDQLMWEGFYSVNVLIGDVATAVRTRDDDGMPFILGSAFDGYFL
jgi:hypothetical protein